MSEIELKKKQLTCVYNAIEALAGMIDIPKELKLKKVQLERELSELKRVDSQLVKE